MANELKIGLGAAATATLAAAAAAAGLTAEVGRTAAAVAATATAGALIADAILGAGAGDVFLAATGVLIAEETAAAALAAVGVARETSIMASFADDAEADSSSSPSHCSIETDAEAAAFDGECCCAGTHGTVDRSSADRGGRRIAIERSAYLGRRRNAENSKVKMESRTANKQTRP